MDEKKRKILEINKRSDLSISEKNKLINEVMKYKNIIKKITNCTSYKRECSVYCNICDDFFHCRLCHDESILSHEFDRFNVSKMKCNYCGEIQKCSQKCIKCSKIMGTYYCDICHLFDSSNKDIMHCKKCGICRIGKDLVHCDDCGVCYSQKNINNHICIPREDSICPICSEDLKNSRKKSVNLPCNHLIHQECLEQYLKNGNYQCPFCKKSIMDMSHLWTQIENYVNSSEMPEEYINQTRQILCNDCNKTSITKFHFEYHQCQMCKGWNTSI